MSARVALVGTGLIGSSLTLAWKAAGAIGAVVGFDAEAGVAERARARGAIDRVAASLAEAAAGAEVIVLAVPVRATARVCEALATAADPAALVTDVGSTKVEVLAAVERALPFPDRFVGAHPIAGTERSGPEAADAALFRGRRCLVTPLASTRPASLAVAESLWRATGALVERMDPREHDRLLAFVSHLPHAAAFALAAAVGADAHAQTAGLWGGGFVDTTRIAASDPVMWRDVFLANAEPILQALERLDGELGELRRAISRGDGAALEALIARARDGRRRVLEGRG